MKGITVEEELCRAARVRRRELEKLFKNIKVILLDTISDMNNNVTFQAREPDRRCYLTYDKLIVDDNVYIFNDLEGRVERLPNKVRSGETSLSRSTVNREWSSAFILVL